MTVENPPSFMSQLWDLVPTMMVLIGLFVAAWWLRRSFEQGESKVAVRTALGPMGLESAVGCLVLMWILPWGFILLVPGILILSYLSPAGRAAWAEHRIQRLTLVVCMTAMVLIAGFVPVSEPVAPEEWGEPLLKENANAPIYPASEQYTWLMLPEDAGLDVEIVQSITMRLPYQYGPIGAASSAFDLSELIGMEQGRLRQAIELLDQQTPGPSLDPDEMEMVPISSESKHRYLSTSADVDESVEVRVYELRSLLSSSKEGTRVGEVLCVATPTFGGELQMLVVVRPILHPGLSSDRFAESLVIEWLSSV
tara:strand:- start:45125 stop:46054 length:930 start_codon:yes stop_codon:yes gene_type:complete